MHPENYSTEATPRGMISAIIPVWKEQAGLEPLLAILQSAPQVAEVIISFADADAARLESLSELGVKCVHAGAPNRGRQLDLGAAAAHGDWLLFHHADTGLTHEHLRALAALSSDPLIVGGAYYRRFDERHPWLRWLEPVERWHNRSFGALYGDQSLFVRRAAFAALGGFRHLPLMEDVDFSRRLRRFGKVQLLDPPIASSPRKHLAHGPWRTTFHNIALLLLYRLGVPPERLHRWYYRRGASGGGAVANHPQRSPDGPGRAVELSAANPGTLVQSPASD